jgi:hypothetical protein
MRRSGAMKRLNVRLSARPGRFHGIGLATAAKFNAFRIRTNFDMRNQSLAFLQETFGKSGCPLLDFAWHR